MTRRERHLAIINNFGRESRRWEFDSLMERLGTDALTDEAVEDFAASLVRSARRRAKMNAANRAIVAARATA